MSTSDPTADAAEYAAGLRADVPQAFMVVDHHGHRSLFLERVAAEGYAVRCHGVVVPLFTQGRP